MIYLSRAAEILFATARKLERQSIDADAALTERERAELHHTLEQLRLQAGRIAFEGRFIHGRKRRGGK